ncbi:malate synthase A [Persicobacter psychrovividus]|uniref:malate synthase n=1 Tax=Persicobacter psychrovividus TaxID=387638 RepID=A0ABM7VKH1_9BACT|nr:malate synthase [Persicobacter psychrovividus]
MTNHTKSVTTLLKNHPAQAAILTEEALQFLSELHHHFEVKRQHLLEQRKNHQHKISQGVLPNFDPITKGIRMGNWQVAPLPVDLLERRVEITGPVHRKMVINALNSGADVFMADFEDSTSPTWENMIDGQANLRDANARQVDFIDPVSQKSYELNEKTATLFVRPRGLHLDEKHLLINGQKISGALFDFGLYFFHNHQLVKNRGTGPYFYLPKLEHYLEARWWNEVFDFAQDYMAVPSGTIKATVLIETITASFMMDEILFELRTHSAGLNCGRWDYIFSYIKKLQGHADFLVPDRELVGMNMPFMKAYSDLLIKTCHKRNVHAMGGMAAQIPIKNDEHAHGKAMDKVQKDKLREAKAGHDGTWVAHPGLIPVAREAFDQHMKRMNNLHIERGDVKVSDEHLLEVPNGKITFEGMVKNIDVGVQYLAAWLAGNGCVPIYNLMEDAATAEISRTQLWQWLHHPTALLSDGRKVEWAVYEQATLEAKERIREIHGADCFEKENFALAAKLFDQMTKADQLEDFLTSVAYEYL